MGPSLHDVPEPLDVIDAIFTTGAHRRLKPDPIPSGIIWAILDAAIRGPSSGNCQRWAWVVVTDEKTKSLIATWYLEAWNGLSLGRRVRLRRFVERIAGRGQVDSVVDLARQDHNYRSGDHLAHNIADAPVWIFAVLHGVEGAPSLVDGADIFGAVQNLMLAARKYRLGTTLTMLHRHDATKVDSLLRLPQGASAIALIPVGYVASNRFFPTRRHPVETVTHWETWGEQRTRPVDRENATL